MDNPNPKIKVLVDSIFAVNPPGNERVYLQKDELRDDLPEELVKRLLKINYIEVLEEKKEPTGADNVRALLDNIVKEAGHHATAKARLAKWASDNINLVVNNASTQKTDDIINQIVAEFESQEEDNG